MDKRTSSGPVAPFGRLSAKGKWKDYQMGSLRIYFFIFIFLPGCGRRSSVPNNTSEAVQTILIEGGSISPFDDTLFLVHIPDIEVMKYEVTNQSFARFIEATGYQTTAEKNHEGMVFDRDEKKWELTKGANWKQPQGPSSTIDEKEFYPVVQVSHKDACAYCEWLGMRLPTELEWEFIRKQDDKKQPVSKNIWQGVFPYEDKGEDGFKGSSPVGYFGSGSSGCYDIQGNVWERCADYYHERWPEAARHLPDSVQYFGPPMSFSEDDMYDTLRVIKGGSFLCAGNYCKGYENSTRMGADPNLGYEHIGFRCVKTKKN